MRARILIPVVVLSTLTMGGMILGATQLYDAEIEDAQRERDRFFTGMVAQAVTSLMLQTNAEQLGELLQTMATHRRHAETINLIAPDGQIAFSSKAALVGQDSDYDPRGVREATVFDRPDHGGYRVVQPIPSGERCVSCHGPQDQILGWLDVRFAKPPSMGAGPRLGSTLLWTGVPALCLLVAISYWVVGREVVRPLHRLVTAMRAAERGEPVVRADEGRPDELGLAARRFDATLVALRNAEQRLYALYGDRMLRAERFATVGELATGLAHEIRNPLAGLSGALELLAEDLREAPLQEELVGEMRHQVTRLGHIVDRLLSYARPATPRMRAVDLNKVVDKALFLVTRQSSPAKVEVVRWLDPDLPIVHADPAQLEQVLLNLCLNACQAMGTAGGRLTVRTFVEHGLACAEVRDTGPGVPSEVRPHLFRPFFTTKSSGTGLGLALSARIVRDHDGELLLRPQHEGSGAAFCMRLPLGDPDAERSVA